MITIRQLVVEVNARIRDLAQGMQPGLAWTVERTRILRCPSGRGRRATVVFRLDMERLARPVVHHSTMMAAARRWMKKRRFPVILDEQHGDAQQLVASGKLVAFNIKVDPARIRIRASTCCAAN